MIDIVITPEIVAAVAASLAAVLSGVSLWLGGRREERRWRREALVDTLVQFLDSSFASPGDVLMRKRLAGTLSDEDHRSAEQAHLIGISALTRLRVTASAAVVEQAERLHMADDTGSDMVLVNTELPGDDEWNQMVRERRGLRDLLLSASRSELGLGSAKPIHPGRARLE
jgi:hypothetical protein